MNTKMITTVISSILCLSTSLSISANEKNNIPIQKNNEVVAEMAIPYGTVFQDEKASLATDHALTSKATGYSIEEVEKTYSFQESFGEYAKKLLSRYPSQVTSIYVEPLPATRGHIKFINEVPAEVAFTVENKDGYIVEGGGIISLSDNHERASLAAEALSDLKYNNTMIFYDLVNDVIKIEMTLPDGLKELNVVDFIDGIREKIGGSHLSGEAKLINESDIELEILKGSDPVYVPTYTRGGAVINQATKYPLLQHKQYLDA